MLHVKHMRPVLHVKQKIPLENKWYFIRHKNSNTTIYNCFTCNSVPYIMQTLFKQNVTHETLLF